MLLSRSKYLVDIRTMARALTSSTRTVSARSQELCSQLVHPALLRHSQQQLVVDFAKPTQNV